tara:strand:+ start:8952 stop:9641 length:690 start_codon:yes stop_codon:yes gene_type:complete
MIDKARKKLAGGGGGTVVLMIGLYLIILAFFILLNAISESSESNYVKASNSLKTAFGFTSGELEKNEEKVNISVEQFYAGISRKVTGIVSSYFPANEFDVSLREGRMRITVPTARFFDGGDVSVTPTMYSFLFDLIRIMNNIKGTHITMEVSIVAPESFDNLKLDASKLKRAALRASDISNIVSQEHLNVESLRTSVNLDEEDLVHLFFDIDITDYQKAILSYKDYLQD